MIVNQNLLHQWVRGHEIEAQGVIAELLGRLVAVSVRNPTEKVFPMADSIGQSGADGYLDTTVGFSPFVPEGKSYWEFGVGAQAGKKATKDYNNRTKATPKAVREHSTFVFVTPLSAVHDWKQSAQAKWRAARLKRREWHDVRVIDGTILIDWLSNWVGVERWLAGKMGIAANDIETPSERWTELSSIGSPPPLTPDLFLANRQAARTKLDEVFGRGPTWLEIDTHFHSQMADVIVAHIATLDVGLRLEIEGRCLIVRSIEAWNQVVALRDTHILVPDFDIDDGDTAGMRLLERAKNQGHAVIFACRPGGPPQPNRASIPDPNEYQITEALQKAGHKAGRARTLSQRSAGSLNNLLRCMRGLSFFPEWAQTTEAADLVIAEMLGAWNENVDGDREVAERLSGKEDGGGIERTRGVGH